MKTKVEYETLLVEVITFEQDDVIVTSVKEDETPGLDTCA